MLATTRSRRSNAGAQMAKLLEDLHEDEFYKSTYGGFEESEEDNDFQSDMEKEVEDEVDSDFSIEEKDEPISDHEENEPKRQVRLVTKAYREPKPAAKVVEKTKPPRPRAKKEVLTADMYERKSIRRSTVAKSAETQQRVKERHSQGKRRHKRNKDYYQEPTQEEKLKEAQITEQENLKSLEKYQKLELEKKKTRSVKKAISGPMIRYHSLAMPIIEGTDGVNDEPEGVHGIVLDDVEMPEVVVPMEETTGHQIELGETIELSSSSDVKPSRDSAGRCERTFITFSDDRTFNKTFRFNRPRPPQRNYCLLTRLPAKYRDPATMAPFSNAATFRALRNVLALHLEQRPNHDPDTAKWLQWHKRERELKAASHQQLACSVRLAPNLQAVQALQMQVQASTPATTAQSLI